MQLEGYNTAEAADDIRDLVLALGLEEVSVAAGGYTAPSAVAFVRSNPGLVRSVLLTNPTPPGESVLADPATSLGRSFDGLIALCEKDPTCGPAFDGLDERYDARFQVLRSQPVGVSTRAISGSGPYDVLLDGRRLGAALESAMRNTGRLGLVPSAVVGASDELTAAAGIDEDVNFFIRDQAPSAAFLSITCSYDARLNRTAEISDAARRQFSGANEPTFGRMCESWGVPSVYDQLSRPLDVDLPVLLASGDLSVSGVNDWAGSLAGTLSDATVVRVPTMSEDLAFAPPPCLGDLRRDFVADPGAPLDVAGCERDVPAIEFVGPT
jgi:pimeloyl-ACP methyl ester carboxylesterase